MKIQLVIPLVIATVTLQASCVSQPPALGTPSVAEKEAGHAIALLSQSCADAWNRGDLKAFLAPYADNAVVVYDSGPEKGIRSLETRLRRSQRWDGQPPQILARIGHSEVSLLDSVHALQTAEIIMQEPARDVHLWVTAVLKRTSRGWVVIHEQSF
jgi:ketosteroid isomerase-like protein